MFTLFINYQHQGITSVLPHNINNNNINNNNNNNNNIFLYYINIGFTHGEHFVY